MLSHAGVGPPAEQIARRHTAVFDHITRLTDNVPAHLVLRCQIDASLSRLPGKNWKRCLRRPRNRWPDLVRQDSNCSAADLWRRAVLCRQGARTTLRPSPADSADLLCTLIFQTTCFISLHSLGFLSFKWFS